MIPAILGNRFGFANVIMLGGVICAVGMFTSSFAPNIYVLYLTYGLVWGFGSCLCNCAALFVLPHFFSARIGLANGIVFWRTSWYFSSDSICCLSAAKSWVGQNVSNISWDSACNYV